jgi:PAS domain-containing protein
VALENMRLYEQLEGKIDLANRELVQAYAGLKLERDRVSAIVSNMADGVLLLDAAHNLVYLNPAAEVMLGVSTEVLGRPCRGAAVSGAACAVGEAPMTRAGAHGDRAAPVGALAGRCC